MEWEEALDAIKNHQLEKLKRTPEQASRYSEFKDILAAKGLTMVEHICQNRLQWPDMNPVNPEFLGDAKDIKVLRNDHPYGFASGIEHLCVWSRARCPCDPNQVPTKWARQRIEAFLKERFNKVPEKDVTWFKNTSALQSVPALEHFHVLIKGHPDLVQQALDG